MCIPKDFHHLFSVVLLSEKKTFRLPRKDAFIELVFVPKVKWVQKELLLGSP